MDASEGFPPVARHDARILILGSLPGQKSLAEHEYYAHPQNAFWRIMREVFGVEGDYASRCRQLTENRIALWDVLASSVRPGSLDADIQLNSARANDFRSFFQAHTQIRLVAFNGRKAQQMYERFVRRADIAASIPTAPLPSTSPAYASMSFSGKLDAWRNALTKEQ